jgi:hypothetical protein
VYVRTVRPWQRSHSGGDGAHNHHHPPTAGVRACVPPPKAKTPPNNRSHNKPTHPLKKKPKKNKKNQQGVLKALNVNKLTKAGCTFKFWVADWFAQLNNKMGGDLKKIQTVGRYMVEVWRAVGMDLSRVQFLNSSEEINSRYVCVCWWWLRDVVCLWCVCGCVLLLVCCVFAAIGRAALSQNRCTHAARSKTPKPTSSTNEHQQPPPPQHP